MEIVLTRTLENERSRELVLQNLLQSSFHCGSGESCRFNIQNTPVKEYNLRSRSQTDWVHSAISVSGLARGEPHVCDLWANPSFILCPGLIMTCNFCFPEEKPSSWLYSAIVIFLWLGLFQMSLKLALHVIKCESDGRPLFAFLLYYP